MNAKLSPEMRKAVAHMKAFGNNKVTRYPGGYWRVGMGFQFTDFGTTTIQALVKRGVAKYTAWQEGRNGKFPIEATLVDPTWATPTTRTTGYAFAAIFYFLCCWGMSRYSVAVEKRLAAGQKR